MAHRMHAYDMSFLEDAEDEGVPQYEGSSPPSTETGGPPSSAGTRPPSLLARSPSEKSTSRLVGLRAPITLTPKSAEVEAWRREQAAGEATDDQIPTEQLTRQLSRMLHVAGDEDTKAVRLEDMTDAEIAQHHFRLAQQHLQAAQRLALAAATAPSAQSNAPSTAPSISSASSTSRARPPAPSSLDTGTRQSDMTPPVIRSTRDAPSPLSSHAPSSVASRRRGPQFSGDSYRTVNDPLSSSPSAASALSHSPGQGSSYSLERAHPPGTHQTLATSPPEGPPPLVHANSSSLSTRSAPMPSSGTAQRPVPPPRRSTTNSSVSTGPMEHASSLVPSLYGGGLSASVLDQTVTGREQIRTDNPNSERTVAQPASGFASEADFVAYAASAPGSNGPRLRDDDAYSVAPTTAEDNSDDGRSDFYGSESVFSHVTRATLPGYDDTVQPVPPVPTIPTHYLSMHMRSDPGDQASAAVGTAVTTRPLAAPDEFHGFRPRQTQSSYMHGLSPLPTAIRSSTLPPAIAQTSSQSLANVQPLAYVIGPAGQPIPVFSSAAFGPGHCPAARPVAPVLPVHERPLQFQHALSYTGQAAQQVNYSNRNVSAGPAPTLTSRPSGVTLPRPALAEPVTRPASAWSDNSDQSNADTRSIAAGSTFSRTKSRMASLRAKVPHVRFMSPDPTVLRAPRGTAGNGPARQAPRTGARRSTAAAAVAVNDVIAEQQEGESEEEREKRQRAIQMSLGMLI